jgi:hypothetical protein
MESNALSGLRAADGEARGHRKGAPPDPDVKLGGKGLAATIARRSDFKPSTPSGPLQAPGETGLLAPRSPRNRESESFALEGGESTRSGARAILGAVDKRVIAGVIVVATRCQKSG